MVELRLWPRESRPGQGGPGMRIVAVAAPPVRRSTGMRALPGRWAGCTGEARRVGRSREWLASCCPGGKRCRAYRREILSLPLPGFGELRPGWCSAQPAGAKTPQEWSSPGRSKADIAGQRPESGERASGMRYFTSRAAGSRVGAEMSGRAHEAGVGYRRYETSLAMNAGMNILPPCPGIALRPVPGNLGPGRTRRE